MDEFVLAAAAEELNAVSTSAREEAVMNETEVELSSARSVSGRMCQKEENDEVHWVLRRSV